MLDQRDDIEETFRTIRRDIRILVWLSGITTVLIIALLLAPNAV